MHSRIRLDIHQRDGKRACRGKGHAWQIYGLSTYIIAHMYLHIYTYIYIYAEHLGAEIRNAPNAPQAHSCTNTHTNIHVSTCMLRYLKIHVHTHTHKYTHIQESVYIVHKDIHPCIHTREQREATDAQTEGQTTCTHDHRVLNEQLSLPAYAKQMPCSSDAPSRRQPTNM